jgi:PAS domain S-box-containing protein
MKRNGLEKIRNGYDGLDWIHQELFRQIPFNAAVIDREFNIVEANHSFRGYFGPWKGKKCYQAYKKANRPCAHCSALAAFDKGQSSVIDELGIDLRGRPAHYVVHITPLRKKGSKRIDYVLEMSTDVTETKHWQKEFQLLFDRVPCYITVIDRDYRITRANESFREEFGDVEQRFCYEVYKKRDSKCIKCPAAQTFRDGKVHKSEQTGINVEGKKTHYIVTTTPLSRGENKVEHVIEISTDITELKHLESEMLEAERLAAVGETVAGLAHSIKNILMGLEGGMYIVSLGLEKEDKARISEGWEMLERNFKKTTTLVKDFLNFAKGQLPELELIDPGEIVNEVVDLYRENIAGSGIQLMPEINPNTKKAPLDRKGIHTCLANLVSNAIDACLMSEATHKYVKIKAYDENGMLVFEVIDNGSGLDYEVKKKIFTTFFTTKGGEGTGLGLLTTRKIINEHGGKILVRSRKGQGARFRIELPRKRLNSLFKKEE